MGNCGSRTTEDVANDSIEKQIKNDRVKLNNEVKLLLLGKKHPPFFGFPPPPHFLFLFLFFSFFFSFSKVLVSLARAPSSSR